MIKTKIATAASIFGLILSAGCSHPRHGKEAVVRETNHVVAAPTVAAVAPGADYAVVQFQKGSHALSEASKAELSRIATLRTTEGRKVNEIKILAWADRDYPTAGSKATKKDVSLADDRADVIKTYIKDDLHSHVGVDKHNMAKRPGFLSELVKTEDYKLKKNLQNADVAPAHNPATLFKGSKESKAIVLITYE